MGCSHIIRCPERTISRLLRILSVLPSRYPKISILAYLVISLSLVTVAYFTRFSGFQPVFKGYNAVGFSEKENTLASVIQYPNSEKDVGEVTFTSTRMVHSETFQLLIHKFDINSYEDVFALMAEIKPVCDFILNYRYENHTYTELCGDYCSDDSMFLCDFATIFDPSNALIGYYTKYMTYSEATLVSLLRSRLPVSLQPLLVNGVPSSFLVLLALPPPDEGDNGTLAKGWSQALIPDLADHYSARVNTSITELAFYSTAYAELEEWRTIRKGWLGCVGFVGCSTVVLVLLNSNFRWLLPASVGLSFAAILTGAIASALGVALGVVVGLELSAMLVLVPLVVFPLCLTTTCHLHYHCQSLLSNALAGQLSANQGPCSSSTRHVSDSTDVIGQLAATAFLSVSLGHFVVIIMFLAASFTAFNAINTVSIFVVLSALSLWISEFVFYVPFLSLFTARSLNCVKHKDFSLIVATEESQISETRAGDDGEVNTDSNTRNVTIVGWFQEKLSSIIYQVNNLTAIRVFWAFIFVVSSCVNSIGVCNMRSDETSVQFYGEQTITRGFFDSIFYSTSQQNMATSVVFKPAANCSDEEFANDMQQLNQYFDGESVWFSAPYEGLWTSCYLEYRSESISDILEDCPTPYREADSSVDLIRFPISRSPVILGDAEQESGVLQEVRRLERRFRHLELFVYDFMMPYMLRNRIMQTTFWKTVLIGIGCSLPAIVFLIPNPMLVVTTVLLTLACLVNTLGVLHWFLDGCWSSLTLLLALACAAAAQSALGFTARVIWGLRGLDAHRQREETQAKIGSPFLCSWMATTCSLTALALGPNAATRYVAVALLVAHTVTVCTCMLVYPALVEGWRGVLDTCYSGARTAGSEAVHASKGALEQIAAVNTDIIRRQLDV